MDLNATQAAIRCGYKAANADVTGPRLLRNVAVRDAVAARQAQQLVTTDLTAARVLEEYRRLAFCDTRQFFTADGNLKPIDKLTPEQGSQLSGIEVIIKNAKAGDGVTDEIHKIKLWDKTKALDSLAKHFGLLKETLDVQGGMTITWQD